MEEFQEAQVIHPVSVQTHLPMHSDEGKHANTPVGVVPARAHESFGTIMRNNDNPADHAARISGEMDAEMPQTEIERENFDIPAVDTSKEEGDDPEPVEGRAEFQDRVADTNPGASKVDSQAEGLHAVFPIQTSRPVERAALLQSLSNSKHQSPQPMPRETRASLSLDNGSEGTPTPMLTKDDGWLQEKRTQSEVSLQLDARTPQVADPPTSAPVVRPQQIPVTPSIGVQENLHGTDTDTVPANQSHTFRAGLPIDPGNPSAIQNGQTALSRTLTEGSSLLVEQDGQTVQDVNRRLPDPIAVTTAKTERPNRVTPRPFDAAVSGGRPSSAASALSGEVQQLGAKPPSVMPVLTSEAVPLAETVSLTDPARGETQIPRTINRSSADQDTTQRLVRRSDIATQFTETTVDEMQAAEKRVSVAVPNKGKQITTIKPPVDMLPSQSTASDLRSVPLQDGQVSADETTRRDVVPRLAQDTRLSGETASVMPGAAQAAFHSGEQIAMTPAASQGWPAGIETVGETDVGTKDARTDLVLFGDPVASSRLGVGQAPFGRNIYNVPVAAETRRDITQQLAATVRASGDSSLDVLLNPVELGRVRISLLPSESGLVVNVQAERPETLDLLRRNADLLAQDLRDVGYDGAQLSFGAQADNGASNHSENANSTLDQREGGMDGPSESEQAVVTQVATLLADRVDIRL